MTVSTAAPRVAGPYVGNGVTGLFPFSFRVFTETDLLVSLTTGGTKVPLALGSGYTVAINPNQRDSPGGTVRYRIAGSPAVLPIGASLLIESAVPKTQPLDITNRGGFYPEVLEAAFDRLTVLIQETAAPSFTPVDSALQGLLAAADGATRITFTVAGGVPRLLSDVLAERVSVKSYGAKGDGATDDTAAIQVALDIVRIAGGGSVYVPPGVYLVTHSLRIGSNTTFYGAGDATVIRAHPTAFVGVNTGSNATTNCQLIQNYNFAATALTDVGIHVSTMLLDYGSVVIAGGGAHAITMRWVDRPTASYVRALKGENVTAFRSCKDSMVFRCHGLDQRNCFFDHWESPGNATVAFCVGRCTTGDINQGIQMNDAGFGGNTTGSVMLVQGNELYGVRSPSGFATALAFGALDVAGQVRRVRSIGNYVEDADIGLVFSGNMKFGLSSDDTFVNVTKLPIFFQVNGSTAPFGCRVLHPHLIDCNHLSVSVAMISVSGTENSVRGIKVSNSTGVPAYASLVWFTPQATNCIAEIDEAQSGSGPRVLNGGVTCRLIDTFDTYMSNGWGPIITPGLGSFGDTPATTGFYTKDGQMVHLDATIVIGTNGSASESLRMSIPFTSDGRPITLVGRAQVSGKAVIALFADTGSVFIVNYDGTYPGATGETIKLAGSYRAAA